MSSRLRANGQFQSEITSPTISPSLSRTWTLPRQPAAARCFATDVDAAVNRFARRRPGSARRRPNEERPARLRRCRYRDIDADSWVARATTCCSAAFPVGHSSFPESRPGRAHAFVRSSAAANVMGRSVPRQRRAVPVCALDGGDPVCNPLAWASVSHPYRCRTWPAAAARRRRRLTLGSPPAPRPCIPGRALTVSPRRFTRTSSRWNPSTETPCGDRRACSGCENLRIFWNAPRRSALDRTSSTLPPVASARSFQGERRPRLGRGHRIDDRVDRFALCEHFRGCLQLDVS